MKTAKANSITALVEQGKWLEKISDIESICIDTCATVLSSEYNGDIPADVTILLTDDNHIKELNHQYRSKNKPTNVLSFPNGEIAQDIMLLGDIVLAIETIEQEAIAQNKNLKSHITHLIVHGALHLLDYDHENVQDADIMEAIEISILKNLGIDNPYNDVIT